MAGPERAPRRVIGLGEEANIGWCVTSGEGLGGWATAIADVAAIAEPGNEPSYPRPR